MLDIENYRSNFLKAVSTDIAEARELFTNNYGVEPDSPKLKYDLKRYGINIQSLSLDELERNRYKSPILRDLYRFKELQQKNVVYGDRFLSYVCDDGRFHAEWYIAEETTGRLICRKPALQGLPREGRKHFIAAPGNDLAIIDYSTIEIRVLARLSGDKNLNDLLQSGRDIHRETASEIFSVSAESVTEKQRAIGKRVNFMACYGVTPVGLADVLTEETGDTVTPNDANMYLTGFYHRYPGVRDYHNSLLSGVISPTTLGGHEFKGLTKSKLLNYPVQASAAEGFKRALTACEKQFPPSWKLVMTIHDEIAYEVPATDSVKAKESLKALAEKEFNAYLGTVPVIAEIKSYI